MELQSAVRAGGVVTDKMVVGKRAPADKPDDPSRAEMRSAFEAMMGALLGMLGAGEQMVIVDTPAAGGSSTGNLANVSNPPDGLSAEGLPTLLDAKATPAGNSPSTANLANVSDLPGGQVADGLPTPLDAKATPATDGQPGQASAPVSEGQEAAPGDAAGSKSVTVQNALPNITIPSQEAGASPADSPVVKEGQTVAQAPAQASTPAIQQLAVEMDGANREKSGQKSSAQPAPIAKGDSHSPLPGMGFTLNSTAAPGSAAAPLKGDAPLLATPAEQIGEQVQVSLGRSEQDATIQLHPKELGSVRIRLQMENGQLHLSIQADQQNTGRLLNSKLADLRQSLEGQGIKVGELAVARSDRTLSTQAVRQPIAPATRSGQMDMNFNNSQPQRQQMAFAGGNFGNESFAGGQNAHPQQAGLHSSVTTSGDVLPVAERPLTYSVAHGRTAVDYYA